MTAAIPSGSEINLDVRPLRAAGQEPFSVIMEIVSRLGPGGVLVLDAPFDPAPLRRLLGSKVFTRDGAPTPTAASAVTFDSIGAKIWRGGDGIHIDLLDHPAKIELEATAVIPEKPTGGNL